MSWGLVKGLLPWILPPVVGAIIGYITNDIAIRMLFRPLRAVRLFGIRLPFTPGIFPRERYSLSQSIGRMVSRELITEEAVRRQLRDQKTVERLGSSLSSLTSLFFALPLSKLSGTVAGLVSDSIRDVLKNALGRLLASPFAERAVKDFVKEAAASLGKRTVSDVFSSLGARAFLSDSALPLLAHKGVREAAAGFLATEVSETAGGLLGDQLIDAGVDALATLADPAVDRLVLWLKTPEMRAELAVRGRGLLSAAMEKLNLFQRFILSAGQFERRLDEKMPDIVEETISALEGAARDPRNRERLFRTLRTAAREWRDGLTDGRERSSRERLAAGIGGIVSRYLAGFEDAGKRRKTAAALEERLAGDGGRTVEDLLRGIPGFGPDETAEKLSAAAVRFMKKPETSEALSERILLFAGRFLEENAEVPVGALIGLDENRKARLDAFLLSRLMDLMDSKLPDILSSIDIQELVVRKIDALEVQEVEKLLLGVIAQHLKWIDVFGAILGFLIGLIQILLRLVGVS